MVSTSWKRRRGICPVCYCIAWITRVRKTLMERNPLSTLKILSMVGSETLAIAPPHLGNEFRVSVIIRQSLFQRWALHRCRMRLVGISRSDQRLCENSNFRRRTTPEANSVAGRNKP